MHKNLSEVYGNRVGEGSGSGVEKAAFMLLYYLINCSRRERLSKNNVLHAGWTHCITGIQTFYYVHDNTVCRMSVRKYPKVQCSSCFEKKSEGLSP